LSSQTHTPNTGDKYLLVSGLFAVNRSERVTRHRLIVIIVIIIVPVPAEKKNKYENFSKTDADVDPFEKMMQESGQRSSSWTMRRK
jgi:hypothetical protein